MQTSKGKRLQITVVTSECRGDHNADVRIAINVPDNETIQGMAERVLVSYTDYIEIRIERDIPEAK